MMVSGCSLRSEYQSLSRSRVIPGFVMVRLKRFIHITDAFGDAE